MRIGSSIIGMESERKYTSVTGRSTSVTIGGGRKSLQDGTGALFRNLTQKNREESKKTTAEEGAERQQTGSFEDLRKRFNGFTTSTIGDTGIRSASSTLREIRQSSIDFLIYALFPIDRRNYMGTQEALPGIGGFSTEAGENGGLQLTSQYFREETEETSFSTEGTVICEDGREISFQINLKMSRSFSEYYEESVQFTGPMKNPLCDPLVINLDGNIAELSDQTFYFDIDGDGKEDEISRLGGGSGFLALDKNDDGVINDGNELFGTKSGNGFKDLREYDTDGNGFIDEGDHVFSKLKIWCMDSDGNPKLYTLAEKGVGAIGLANGATDFTLVGDTMGTKGVIRNTGFFLYENGGAGTVQHVDMALYGRRSFSRMG